MVKFEYDPDKSAANRAKHGMSLEEAQALWEGPTIVVQARSDTEARWMLLGLLHGKCYACFFTVRGDIIRLISARRSRRKEERYYYEKIQTHDERSGTGYGV